MKRPDVETQWPASKGEWKTLFAELCSAHRLTWRQKWLLRTISKTLDVKPAARLFIEPDWFAEASKIEELQHRRGQLVELCQLLFYRDQEGHGNVPLSGHALQVPTLDDEPLTLPSTTDIPVIKN